jgi:hypothetical protein
MFSRLEFRLLPFSWAHFLGTLCTHFAIEAPFIIVIIIGFCSSPSQCSRAKSMSQLTRENVIRLLHSERFVVNVRHLYGHLKQGFI